EMGVDPASLPASANDVSRLAWPLIDPERKDWGGEAKGLVLARCALERAPELPPGERARLHDALACARLANGRLDDAAAEEKRALEEASPDRKKEFEGYLSKLEKEIFAETDPDKEAERIAELERHVAALEAGLSAHPELAFADAQDKWWFNQLDGL